MIVLLFVGNLEKHRGRRGGGRGGGTVQQLVLHGILLSNFAFGPVGGVLKRIADFAQMKSGDVPVALIVPFRCATSENKSFYFFSFFDKIHIIFHYLFHYQHKSPGFNFIFFGKYF